MNGDKSRPVSLVMAPGFLVLGSLLLAACGSQADTSLSLPDDVGTQASADADPGDVASPTADDTAAEPVDERPEEVEISVGDQIYTPRTVRFDPDSPPDQAELEDLVFDAVSADFENSFWCWGNTEVCNVERHLGPAVAGSRVAQLEHDLETYLSEGGVYKAGDLDGIYRVEVLATTDRGYDLGSDNQFRAVGDVVACEAYNGTYFVPHEDGTPREVINDEPAGFITTFQVWQDREGVLRVFSRAFQEEGGVEVCDPFKG
jgi:hypothetical protein